MIRSASRPSLLFLCLYRIDDVSLTFSSLFCHFFKRKIKKVQDTMARLYFFLYSFLLAASANAFHTHQYGNIGSSKSSNIFFQKGTSGPFCRRTIQEKEDLFSTGLLPYYLYKTTATPSPSTHQNADSKSERPVGRLMDFLCCGLFLMLCDPLPVAAKSAAASYSEEYGYWGNFGFLIAPGLPMLVTVIGCIYSLSSSFKAELKTDMGLLETNFEKNIDSLKSEMKADFATLGSKIDALAASIGRRLDNQDQKFELAVRELQLQERENNMKN
jgi:hypothetical protein